MDILHLSIVNASHLSQETMEGMKALIERSVKAVTRVRESAILNFLRFPEMNKRFDEIADAHEKTFRWLLDDESLKRANSDIILSIVPSKDITIHDSFNMQNTSANRFKARMEARERFVNRLEQQNGIFHVSGKPGSGKSTLMKFICRHSNPHKHLRIWSGQSKLATGNVFF